MVTLAAILNILPSFGRISTHRVYRVASYHMHLFSLCSSYYLNIISNKRRYANDIQDVEKYKMAATFHILSFIEPIVNYFSYYVSLANGLVQFNFLNLC